MRLAPFCFFAACALVVGASCANPADASQVGVWQFNDDLSNELPGGAAMSILGGWSETYATEMIGGSPATQLEFPAMSSTQALDMPNQAAPNGGGTMTNNWSIVMDVRFPSAGNYTSLWETGAVGGGGDGDYFVRDTEGIGISTVYGGAYTPSNWTRIAVTIDTVVTPGEYTATGYIDGVYATSVLVAGTLPPDGREAIGAILHLFHDEGGDDETSAGLVNSVAYYDEVLSASAIAALGGASAAGIPAVPEPASLVLFGGALGLLALVRGRRLGC